MELSFYNSIDELPVDKWNKVLNEKNFFLTIPFLKIIEQHHRNTLKPVYIILSKNGNVKGVLYGQIISIKGSKLSEYINSKNKIVDIIGAANVLIFSKKGHVKGKNTDVYGFKKSILKLVKNKRKKNSNSDRKWRCSESNCVCFDSNEL